MKKSWSNISTRDLNLIVYFLNLLLAMWYDASGATEKALPYFNEAVALSIDCHSVYYFKTCIWISQKKYKKHLKQNQMNSLNEMGLEIKTVKDQWESNAFDLTSREFEVLALLNDGLSNKSISEKLFISVGTTKWHLNNIYGKLGVGRRTEALTFARDQGLFLIIFQRLILHNGNTLHA